MTDAFDHPTPPARARIEIIPLIDVIFFLLATFVLFTLSLEKIRSLEALLPKAGQETGAPDSTLFLQAAADDTYSWSLGKGGTPEVVTREELRARLEHYRRTADVPRVFVRGEGGVRFGAAVLAMDEARAAGIREVAVQTTVSATGF